jgi:hypothetical protein
MMQSQQTPRARCPSVPSRATSRLLFVGDPAAGWRAGAGRGRCAAPARLSRSPRVATALNGGASAVRHPSSYHIWTVVGVLGCIVRRRDRMRGADRRVLEVVSLAAARAPQRNGRLWGRDAVALAPEPARMDATPAERTLPVPWPCEANMSATSVWYD